MLSIFENVHCTLKAHTPNIIINSEYHPHFLPYFFCYFIPIFLLEKRTFPYLEVHFWTLKTVSKPWETVSTKAGPREPSDEPYIDWLAAGS